MAQQRLDKVLADLGIGSRKELKEWIRAGRVRIDGAVCLRPEQKLDPDAQRLSLDGRELCVTLAGPAVNLLCAPPLAALSKRFGWDWGLLLAGAHGVLGAYNLLPIPPLDGARSLYLLAAYCVSPAAGERVGRLAGLLCALALAALALKSGAALFLFGALGLLLPQLGLAKPRGSV